MFNKTLVVIFLGLTSLTPFSRAESDQDIDAIVAAVQATPCEYVQVLVAGNFGAVRWNRSSMRYLYDPADLAALAKAAESSGKRVIRVEKSFEIPNFGDPNWGEVADKLASDLREAFEQDYAAHPPSGC